MREYKVKISAPDIGRRLDLFLADFSRKKNLGFSRTAIQKLIADGKIILKGLPLLKANYKVRGGDEFILKIEDKSPSRLQPEDLPLEIVYADPDLAIINKPCGLVVHPAPGNYSHTLVNALLWHFKKLSDVHPQRPGIVHRLDKDTSGLLVIAKNNAAHLELAKQFARHSIKRKYVALVKGRVDFDEDIIEIPIGRHPYKRKNMSCRFGKKTKYAKTYYRTLKRSDNFSLLELEPFTGRTHQLRVHLAFLGHPILGDAKYGKNNAFSRLALHAYHLGFVHPTTKKLVEFSCAVPKEFSEHISYGAGYLKEQAT